MGITGPFAILASGAYFAYFEGARELHGLAGALQGCEGSKRLKVTHFPGKGAGKGASAGGAVL